MPRPHFRSSVQIVVKISSHRPLHLPLLSAGAIPPATYKLSLRRLSQSALSANSFRATGRGEFIDVTPLYVNTVNPPIVTVTHSDPHGPACVVMGANAVDSSVDDLMPDPDALNLAISEEVKGRLPDWQTLLSECGFKEEAASIAMAEESAMMTRKRKLPPQFKGKVRAGGCRAAAPGVATVGKDGWLVPLTHVVYMMLS